MTPCKFLIVPALLIWAGYLPEMAVAASTPRLNLILPRGVQRGHEHQLRFSGERLDAVQEIFFYDHGIDVLEIIPVDSKNIDVRIAVSSNCRMGEHLAQVRTQRGISDYRSLYVGALTEVTEVEPNNSLGQSQSISMNCTVNGTIRREDVDVFAFTAKQGERVSVEIEAIRLGFMFDPFISLVDDQNFELAVSDDSVLHRQDGLISVQIPADGEYFVLVREASYEGNDNSHYRLHIGNFPRPLVAYPSAAPPGETAEIRLLGDPLGPLTRMVEVPESFGFRSGLFVEDEHGITPSPVSFDISRSPNVFEQEPNNSYTQVTQASSVPCSFHGIIAEPGDEDYFRFNAHQGTVLDIECFARRIGSGLDSVINVFDGQGKHLVGDDDARRPDSYVRVTIPADGDYFVRVRDHLNRGQADFVYRVDVGTVQPSLSISIPRVDRYSQLRQQIVVPRGNRFGTLISASRVNFGGELVLLPAEWPSGITVNFKPMSGNLNLMPVVFEATEDAEMAGSLVDLQARHIDESTGIVGGFAATADFALGPPNNATYYTADVDRLACAVTEALPFKIDIVEPQVPLVRNGSLNLKIVVTRKEGFDEPIQLQFPFRPPGVGTVPQIEMKRGESEVSYPLNANANAQIGRWPIYAIGQSNVDGPVWASTQLAELQIAESPLVMEMPRAACHQGESTSIHCTINHHRPLEGPATAQLMGLPPQFEIQALKFDSQTSELSFLVHTNETCPVGKHKGLFCQVTIVEHNEPIVFVAARSELQVNPPQPAALAEKESPVQSSPPPAPTATSKPLSRLQQLRAKKGASAPRD